ncbi:MAG: competence protein ComK, partial [Bacillus sp. (in: firmicutes)]
PTHSPNNMHCCWIFFHHVYRIKKSSTSSPAIRSIIIYKNGQELAMKESASILEKQLFRTWLCIKTLNGDGPSYSLQMEG